jgi:HD-GYP domain-containing protein (c-di-GMP phosphodiesterase class II)
VGARSHHERRDGSGYPRGVSSDELLDGAKVPAVADVVEAMASHRPYRAALVVEVRKNRYRDSTHQM